jgi:hypothetical protein
MNQIMRRIFTLLVMALLPFLGNAQDTIVAWTFPSTSADSLADVYNSNNSGRYLSCQYGTSGAPTYLRMPIDYTTNGSLGSPDKCGKTVGWNNATDSAFMMVKFKTTGYGTLKLYSKIQAGGSNPGPRDFVVQCKLPGTNPWISLDTITCANDWTTGAVNGVDLPTSFNNQSSQVSVRWLIISNYDINGGTLLSTGICKIDDIVVTGTLTTGINEPAPKNLVNIYPNPNHGSFMIENDGDVNQIAVYNMLGDCVYKNENVTDERTFLSGLKPGLFIIKITSASEETSTYKIIVE